MQNHFKKTAILSHPDCLLHEMGEMHPEQPDRIRVIAETLEGCDFKKQLHFYEAPEVTLEQLLRAHDPAYIDEIFKKSPEQHYYYLDPDTAMNRFTLKAALRAAGAVVKAVDLVIKQEAYNAFCNIRPPGHHAEYNRGMGFCFFNNVAIGVAHALAHHKLNRIAIIDFDVHHGNGTENIFQDDERILFCSSFQFPLFPYSGVDTKSNHILNIPLPAGATGLDFFSQVENNWIPALRDFKPEMIFFSAGFDGHRQDELATLRFEAEDYGKLTREIKLIAKEFCEGRMISSLEGGYALDVLGACVAAHVRELTAPRYEPTRGIH